MKKIAILVGENISIRRGAFNASHNRIKHLMTIADYEIDVFAIQAYERWYVRLLRHSVKRKKEPFVIVDGIRYNILWYSFSIIDYVLTERLHKKALFSNRQVNKIASMLKEYDIISCHSSGICGLSTYMAHKMYHKPFFATWHGSDIHSIPFRSDHEFDLAKLLIESATANFYVSEALLEKSKEICSKQNSIVLYNGAGSEFRMFSPVERQEAKKQFGFPHKVVAFVGNIVEIKNVLLLPSIFQNVQRKYSDKSISFWVIGDGELRDPLIKMLNKAVGHFKFWGDQPPSMMPTFMNCIDVLVLPSKNEGLPLVTLEALSCGANVVGARVGGIAECVGVDNTFEHDAHFVENISDRIVEMLNNKIIQRIPPKMNWQSSAQTENDIYRHFLYNGEGSSMPI